MEHPHFSLLNKAPLLSVFHLIKSRCTQLLNQAKGWAKADLNPHHDSTAMHDRFRLAQQSQYFIKGICVRVATVFHFLSSDSEKELESRACFSGCEDQRKVGPKSKERGEGEGSHVWEKPYWAPEEALGIKVWGAKGDSPHHPTLPWGKVESEKNWFQGQHVTNKHNLKNAQPHL